MVMICKLNSFLKANGIKKNSFVSVHPVGARTDAVRLEFQWEDTDENNK